MENNELSTITNDAPEFSRGMYCSIHAETQADRLDIYEAVSNSLSLDDMVGKVVEVENVIIQPVEMTDNATGEQTVRFAIVGCPPWNPAIAFDVVKKQGRNGYKFTTLQRHK